MVKNQHIRSVYYSKALAEWSPVKYNQKELDEMLTWSYRKLKQKAEELGIDSHINKNRLALSVLVKKNVFYPDQAGRYSRSTLAFFVRELNVAKLKDEMTKSYMQKLLLDTWKGGNDMFVDLSLEYLLDLQMAIYKTEESFCSERMKKEFRKKVKGDFSPSTIVEKLIYDTVVEFERWKDETDIVKKREQMKIIKRLKSQAESHAIRYLELIYKHCKGKFTPACGIQNIPAALNMWAKGSPNIANKAILCNVKVRGRAVEFREGEEFVNGFTIYKVVISGKKNKSIWLGVGKKRDDRSNRKGEEIDEENDDSTVRYPTPNRPVRYQSPELHVEPYVVDVRGPIPVMTKNPKKNTAKVPQHWSAMIMSGVLAGTELLYDGIMRTVPGKIGGISQIVYLEEGVPVFEKFPNKSPWWTCEAEKEIPKGLVPQGRVRGGATTNIGNIRDRNKIPIRGVATKVPGGDIRSKFEDQGTINLDTSNGLVPQGRVRGGATTNIGNILDRNEIPIRGPGGDIRSKFEDQGTINLDTSKGLVPQGRVRGGATTNIGNIRDLGENTVNVVITTTDHDETVEIPSNVKTNGQQLYSLISDSNVQTRQQKEALFSFVNFMSGILKYGNSVTFLKNTPTVTPDPQSLASDLSILQTGISSENETVFEQYAQQLQSSISNLFRLTRHGDRKKYKGGVYMTVMYENPSEYFSSLNNYFTLLGDWTDTAFGQATNLTDRNTLQLALELRRVTKHTAVFEDGKKYEIEVPNLTTVVNNFRADPKLNYLAKLFDDRVKIKSRNDVPIEHPDDALAHTWGKFGIINVAGSATSSSGPEFNHIDAAGHGVQTGGIYHPVSTGEKGRLTGLIQTKIEGLTNTEKLIGIFSDIGPPTGIPLSASPIEPTIAAGKRLRALTNAKITNTPVPTVRNSLERGGVSFVNKLKKSDHYGLQLIKDIMRDIVGVVPVRSNELTSVIKDSIVSIADAVLSTPDSLSKVMSEYLENTKNTELFGRMVYMVQPLRYYTYHHHEGTFGLVQFPNFSNEIGDLSKVKVQYDGDHSLYNFTRIQADDMNSNLEQRSLGFGVVDKIWDTVGMVGISDGERMVYKTTASPTISTSLEMMWKSIIDASAITTGPSEMLIGAMKMSKSILETKGVEFNPEMARQMFTGIVKAAKQTGIVYHIESLLHPDYIDFPLTREEMLKMYKDILTSSSEDLISKEIFSTPIELNPAMKLWHNVARVTGDKDLLKLAHGFQMQHSSLGSLMRQAKEYVLKNSSPGNTAAINNLFDQKNTVPIDPSVRTLQILTAIGSTIGKLNSKYVQKGIKEALEPSKMAALYWARKGPNIPQGNPTDQIDYKNYVDFGDIDLEKLSTSAFKIANSLHLYHKKKTEGPRFANGKMLFTQWAISDLLIMIVSSIDNMESKMIDDETAMHYYQMSINTLLAQEILDPMMSDSAVVNTMFKSIIDDIDGLNPTNELYASGSSGLTDKGTIYGPGLELSRKLIDKVFSQEQLNREESKLLQHVKKVIYRGSNMGNQLNTKYGNEWGNFIHSFASLNELMGNKLTSSFFRSGMTSNPIQNANLHVNGSVDKETFSLCVGSESVDIISGLKDLKTENAVKTAHVRDYHINAAKKNYKLAIKDYSLYMNHMMAEIGEYGWNEIMQMVNAGAVMLASRTSPGAILNIATGILNLNPTLKNWYESFKISHPYVNIGFQVLSNGVITLTIGRFTGDLLPEIGNNLEAFNTGSEIMVYGTSLDTQIRMMKNMGFSAESIAQLQTATKSSVNIIEELSRKYQIDYKSVIQLLQPIDTEYAKESATRILKEILNNMEDISDLQHQMTISQHYRNVISMVTRPESQIVNSQAKSNNVISMLTRAESQIVNASPEALRNSANQYQAVQTLIQLNTKISEQFSSVPIPQFYKEDEYKGQTFSKYISIGKQNYQQCGKTVRAIVYAESGQDCSQIILDVRRFMRAMTLDVERQKIIVGQISSSHWIGIPKLGKLDNLRRRLDVYVILAKWLYNYLGDSATTNNKNTLKKTYKRYKLWLKNNNVNIKTSKNEWYTYSNPYYYKYVESNMKLRKIVLSLMVHVSYSEAVKRRCKYTKEKYFIHGVMSRFNQDSDWVNKDENLKTIVHFLFTS
jgi:hypothetical protein